MGDGKPQQTLMSGDGKPQQTLMSGDGARYWVAPSDTKELQRHSVPKNYSLAAAPPLEGASEASLVSAASAMSLVPSLLSVTLWFTLAS